MLSIGARNPYLQTVGVKKQQQSYRSSSPRPVAAAPSKTSTSSFGASGQSMGTLDIMAMNNLLHASNMSPEIRNPALESLNANINKSLTKEKSNVSDLSSKLGQSKSKLSEITSALSASNGLGDQEKEIYQLIASALQSEVKAFEELLNKAKYAVSQLSDLANYGVNKVVGESNKSPDLLEMLSRSNSEYSADASSKLIHMASTSGKAVKKLGSLVQSGKVDLKKASVQAKKEDPQKTAEGLDNLYRATNLSKEDRLTVTHELTSIACDNPLNGAGQAAAGGLENIFKKDSGTVAKNAAVGLRFAAIAGNGYATDGLINVAKSPSAGKSKNQEAIMQLTKVAKSGVAQSQKATDALTGMVESPNFNGKIKEQLIDSLGQIAYNGGNNGKKALESLAGIAGNDRSPYQKFAMDNILKQKNSNILGNEKVVQAFSNIADSKRVDSKSQIRATGKLGEAASFGGAQVAQKAQDSLTKVATNPMSKAAPEALNQLKQQGVNNLSKNNQGKIDHQFGTNFENNGLAHFRSKSKSNPFFNSSNPFKQPMVKAIAF
ncbi:MAG: hypothetical protein AB1782_13455 [Cyanobacteriota bacterium]